MDTTAIASRRTASVAVRLRRSVYPYVWISPALLVFGVFTLLPLAAGVALSLVTWDGIHAVRWEGLGNYVQVLQDQAFWQALVHNVIYALGTVVGKIVIAFVLAVLLNRALPGRAMFRTILFMPVVMSFVVVGLIWSWVYNYNFGLLNAILGFLGLPAWKQDWLGNPSLALGGLIVVDMWKWFGFHMVIFLAGLQSIPNELYEAARIDGANAWQSFRRVTVPLLKGIVMINVLLATSGAFNVFDLVYVMTEGGPVNATDVGMLHIYTQAFQYYQFGYSAAMSYVLLIVVSMVSLVLMRVLRHERYL
jgi:ABC-type sugar transport system permease subunit